MTEEIIYPTINLFLYDLKDGLGEDETKVNKNCENFCRKIYNDLDEKEFSQKVAQFEKYKNFDTEDIELLETRTRSFASPLDGYYYPLQVNDTYSLLVDYSGKLDANGKLNDQIQGLDDEPFLNLKQKINNLIGEQPGTIGQTLLLWGKLTSPKTDVEIEEIAQKYRELRKREIVMDEFLSGFEENKSNETEQLYNTRRTIVNYLEVISKVS